MADKKTVEDSFREALADVVEITKKLAPYCSSVAEMVEMMELAQSNNSQLSLLIGIVKAK